MQLMLRDASEIPDQYIPQITEILIGYGNETRDFSKPLLDPHFANTYPVFVAIYGVLILASSLANFAMIRHIFYHKLHKEATCAFLVNISLANLLHVMFVLPLTLEVILTKNFIFGQFMCYCLPMLQDTPIHVTMMTYVLIAADRYRFLIDPRKARIPAFVCAMGSWFFAICLVLPFPVYTSYFDAAVSPLLRGLQLCYANLMDDIKEYMRSLFIGTYLVPLALIMYLYVRASRELERHETLTALATFKTRLKKVSNPAERQNSNTSSDVVAIHTKREVGYPKTSGGTISAVFEIEECDVDVRKEKRTQKYLICMVVAFAACLGPLMLLRLIRPAIKETYYNTHHVGLVYIALVWIAFLPSLLTPCFYAQWQMKRFSRFLSSRRSTGVSGANQQRCGGSSSMLDDQDDDQRRLQRRSHVSSSWCSEAGTVASVSSGQLCPVGARIGGAGGICSSTTNTTVISCSSIPHVEAAAVAARLQMQQQQQSLVPISHKSYKSNLAR
ncbi:orexin receptor type 1 isoform X1 [Trichogramma pretiosum]|uniref:orexin receptor type 1 isoform X1 n=2 Tax=Trichogramma pretiosum TaxID=7493 RepID=UPI000C71A157|nr:orexin receptor type 1 isoform X1 [Trichogramma pretiosum]